MLYINHHPELCIMAIELNRFGEGRFTGILPQLLNPIDEADALRLLNNPTIADFRVTRTLQFLEQTGLRPQERGLGRRCVFGFGANHGFTNRPELNRFFLG
jgi:hypothetical protein